MTRHRPGVAGLAPAKALAAISTLAVVSTLAAAPAAAAAVPGPPPVSMAGMGDSITRGFNACGWYVDCTARSFATGTSDGVRSHYLRILAVSPAIRSRNHNVARSGAKAADMPGQAAAAVSQGVDYVTLLIGANDACTGTEAAMTPVPAFRTSIDAALGAIRSGRPTARVLVISIPDVRRLWDVGRVNASARNTWALFKICQSMLANPTSLAATDEARRNRVRQRVVDFNSQLAAACAAYGANCRYDNNAIFNYPFALGQVSGFDYFHPNTAGQTVIAQTSYTAGFAW